MCGMFVLLKLQDFYFNIFIFEQEIIGRHVLLSLTIGCFYVTFIVFREVRPNSLPNYNSHYSSIQRGFTSPKYGNLFS